MDLAQHVNATEGPIRHKPERNRKFPITELPHEVSSSDEGERSEKRQKRGSSLQVPAGSSGNDFKMREANASPKNKLADENPHHYSTAAISRPDRAANA